MSGRHFELATSPHFASWLGKQRSSLAFTTYQTGKIFLIGLQPTGRLSIFERTLERVMGLFATSSTLYMSTLYQIWRFENLLSAGEQFQSYDAVYVVFGPRYDMPLFRRGDCNGERTVDISDAVFSLGTLFLGDGDPSCDDACDSNDDGAVDISDAIATLGVLFLGNGVIPPPGSTECSLDLTDDGIAREGAGHCS